MTLLVWLNKRPSLKSKRVCWRCSSSENWLNSGNPFHPPKRHPGGDAPRRRRVARLPWGQLTRRIFDQGGWVKRNPETHIMLVTLKAFDNAVIQAAMERLCEQWNQKAAQMPCEDGVYTLQFACQSPPSPL